MIDFIGHTLNKVVYNSEEQTLSLTIDNDKVFLLKVEGDCCSSGKFLGVKEPWNLPSIITSAEDTQASFQNREYTVYEQILTLENGNKLTILYDNESNGYYGSSLNAYYGDQRIWEFADVEAKNA